MNTKIKTHSSKRLMYVCMYVCMYVWRMKGGAA